MNLNHFMDWKLSVAQTMQRSWGPDSHLKFQRSTQIKSVQMKAQVLFELNLTGILGVFVYKWSNDQMKVFICPYRLSQQDSFFFFHSAASAAGPWDQPLRIQFFKHNSNSSVDAFIDRETKSLAGQWLQWLTATRSNTRFDILAMGGLKGQKQRYWIVSLEEGRRTKTLKETDDIWVTAKK